MKSITYKGYLIGLLLVVLALAFMSLDYSHQWRMPGPFNTGHEKLNCNECHEDAKGSIRQQIQANLSYLFGKKELITPFNMASPDSKDCLSCHTRENDNHPIYRFNEPRFREVRKAIAPQNCVSCHEEHTGVRVSSDPENCQHCHDEIEIKNDPLDISHSILITLKKWDTCLACHDFHGNHVMTVANKIKSMKKTEEIKIYFSGGKDPYSDKKYEKSKETRYETKSD